ncbi:hypothetical protein CsSME_00052190 [Camellia sinensis var. sinensis]
MDGSDNGFSSSTSSKPSPIQKFSQIGESDENCLNYDKMAWQNPKKPPTKHFMSPTISTASKAATPRKKILAERNEESLIFSNTHHQKAPNLDSRSFYVNLGVDGSDRSSSPLMPVYNRVSESDEDYEQNSFVSDSSSKPYDPLRNYLSPRPKFLRYKPNRRREIFLGQENERGERKEDGYGVKRNVVSFDFQRKEDSSSEDARSPSASSSQDGFVRKEDDDHIIKKSDDSDDADEEFEEFEGDEEEGKCLNLKAAVKFFLVFVTLFHSTLFISSMNSPTPSPTQQAISGLKNRYDKIHNHTFELATVKLFEGKGTKMADGFEKGLLESTDELGEVVEMQIEQSKAVCAHELDEAEEEVPETANGEEDVYDEELEKKEGDETAESDYYVDDHNTETTMEGSDQLNGTETEEIAEKFESSSNSENEADGCSSIKDEPIEDEAKIEAIQGISIDGESKMEHSKTELIQVTVIGIVLFFMIIATSVLGFHFRHKKTYANQSVSIEKQLPKSVLAEKTKTGPVEEPVLPPNMEEHVEKVESFANASHLIHSIEESSKDFYQIRAPTVELLGELVVGESNNSASQENEMMRSKARTVSSQAQASASEFSSTNSPSYGSFTAEKKILRRREDGEVKTVVVTKTPVRRSSRIHNRAVMSP